MNSKVDKKSIFGWAMFDFANSSFTTVIVTAFFAKYFINVIVGEDGHGNSLWGLAIGISQVLVIFTAPIFGALSDAFATKKKFLFFSYLGCSVCTIILSFCGPGMIITAMIFFILANFFFSSGENFISSFLPDLVPKKLFGRISGIAWGFGYVGGISSLLISVLILENNKTGHPYVWSFIGVWFLLAAIPTFLFVPETKNIDLDAQNTFKKNKSFYSALTFSLFVLKRQLWEAKKFKILFKYFLGSVFYLAAVGAVVSFASIIAEKKLGFQDTEFGIFLIGTNIFALIGATSIGFFQDKFGSKFALILSIVGWLLAIGLIEVSDKLIQNLDTVSLAKTLFWVAGCVVGFSMGAIYSSSRALTAILSPKSRSGEFFGVYGVFSKFATILGPLLFGIFTDLFSMSIAIYLMAGFFICGLLLLIPLNIKQGQLDASDYDARLEVK